MFGRFRLHGRLPLSSSGSARAAVSAKHFHSATPLRALGGRQTQAANRSVVASQAYEMALEEAGQRGDFQTMLRIGMAFNRSRLKITVPVVNSVISAYARADMRGEAFKYFASMKELRLDPNVDSFNAVLGMWARFGDVHNLLIWLRAMRRNQTLPNRDTVRMCRHAFMVRGKMNNQFTYLKDAKTLKRLLSITPDVVAQAKQAHATNVLERSQRRARWVQQLNAKAGADASTSASAGDQKDKALSEAEAAAALAAEQAAASESVAATGKPAGGKEKASKADKKAKADKAAAKAAAAAAQEANLAALSRVRSRPEWDAMIHAVEGVHPSNSASAVGIPDTTDSTQNAKRYARKKAHPKNPESLADAASRAFVELARPVSTRRFAVEMALAKQRDERAAKREQNRIKHEEKVAAAAARKATATRDGVYDIPQTVK